MHQYGTTGNFNPRSPHGERLAIAATPLASPYFNPRSPHGERLRRFRPAHKSGRISIHAPRTGSDRQGSRSRETARYFNPRSPHGERPAGTRTAKRNGRFQSTLPARGATVRRDVPPPCVAISIHAPRTGSDTNDFVTFLCVYNISIHAPRTGSDNQAGFPGRKEGISIHAPRTGSDSRRSREPEGYQNFNPRSPHGERR